MTVVGPESRAGLKALRVARRALHSLRARLEAARARRGLRYPETQVLYWDLPDRVRLPGLTQDGAPPLRYAPGRRPSRTGQAAGDRGRPRRRRRGEARVSFDLDFVALAVDGSLLRVAIGPTRAEIDNGIEAPDALRAPLAVGRRSRSSAGRLGVVAEQVSPTGRSRRLLTSNASEDVPNFRRLPAVSGRAGPLRAATSSG